MGSLHGLGFLEEGLAGQETPAGAPLHGPRAPPSEHQSLCQPLAWLRGLTRRGEAVGDTVAPGGGLPRARTGSLLSGITEWALAGRPHIRSPRPPHPRPGEDPASETVRASLKAPGLSSGAARARPATLQQCPLWASQACSSDQSHTPPPLCPDGGYPGPSAPMHTCHRVCARALGPLPSYPCGPHTPAHTHTHVSSPHSCC